MAAERTRVWPVTVRYGLADDGNRGRALGVVRRELTTRHQACSHRFEEVGRDDLERGGRFLSRRRRRLALGLEEHVCTAAVQSGAYHAWRAREPLKKLLVKDRLLRR